MAQKCHFTLFACCEKYLRFSYLIDKMGLPYLGFWY